MPSLPIRMPQLGESAANAVIKEWLAEVGDTVEVDQDILEVETEKSILTVTAPANGELIKHEVAVDAEVAVGDVVGYIEVDNDDAALARDRQQAKPERRPDTGRHAATPNVTDEARTGGASGLDVPVKTAGQGYYSPRLRARLSEFGLRKADLAAIKGSGKAGRVSAQDLESFLETMAQSEATKASPMRIAVADSMRRSWTRPLATVAMDVDMVALSEHRRGVEGRPSATIYAIKALATGLAQNDHLACRLIGDRLVHPESIDIAFAVEIDDGVRTPVIQNIPALDLAALTAAYNESFAKAKDPRQSVQVLNLPSIASVSNFGTFGIHWATPIPLPDHSLVLGLGAVRKVPDWNPADKNWGMTRQAEISITFDHRVADGGAAGRLLKVIRDLMEHPEKL